MSRNKTPRRCVRRGYSMIVVMVFLAVMLSALAVTQRRLGSVLRVESRFADSESRGDRAQAMGRALDVLWTGRPPTDRYEFATIVETSTGPLSYTIVFEHEGGDHWTVTVEPTALGDDPPPLPASF